VALGFTNLETTGNTANLTVYTTGSVVTASEGDVILAFVNIVGGPRTGTLTTSGLTWVPVRSTTYNTTNTLELHYAIVGVGGISGQAVTITCSAGANQCQWTLCKVTGAKITGGGPVVQCPAAATGTGTSGTQTLSAAADSNNRTVGASGHGAFEGTTHPTGFTELGDSPQNSPACAFNSFYHPSTFQTSIQPSWTTSSGFGVLAAEIAILPTGATVHGTAVGSFAGLTATALGHRTVHGAAAGSFAGLTATASGHRTVHGAAAASFPALVATALGEVATPPITHGTASATFATLVATAHGRQSTPFVPVTGAVRYAPGWEGLRSGYRQAAGEAEQRAQRPEIDCPLCGTPLEYARGLKHCPLGHYTVPA